MVIEWRFLATGDSLFSGGDFFQLFFFQNSMKIAFDIRLMIMSKEKLGKKTKRIMLSLWIDLFIGI